MRCDAHLYKRIKRPSGYVYKCQRCPHYIGEDLVIGRLAECWYCHEQFKMTINALLLKPHCGCRFGTRTKGNLKAAKEAIFDQLMKRMG